MLGENICKRKDGRWEARVIKGYNEKGRAIYAYFYGYSYNEVKNKVYHKDTQFCILLDLWLERKKIRLKKSSYIKYFNLINKHIKIPIGDFKLIDINNAMLNPYIAEKYKNGLSEKTLKDIIAIIKSVLRFAKEENFLYETPIINIIFPREKTKNMRILSKDEQKALEVYLLKDMNTSKLGVLLCLYTGLRIGEICSLKWKDILNNTLTVKSTMQRIQTLDISKKTEVIITEPKSNCSLRTIPLPNFLANRLEVFRPNEQDAFLLTGKVENYIEPRTYHNHFKSYISAAGIKNANFHSIRHTFATRCVEVGFEIKSLSEILGHSNITITLNRYVHPSFDLKQNNMNKLKLLN